MSDPRMTYLQYLVWTTANTVSSLSDAIRMAMDMEDDQEAVRVLERRLDAVPALASYKKFNPEVVAARPADSQEDKT